MKVTISITIKCCSCVITDLFFTFSTPQPSQIHMHLPTSLTFCPSISPIHNFEHICQAVRKLWCMPQHDRKALAGLDHTLRLAHGRPAPYSSLPAFQVEYITCTWLPRTRHTSSWQDKSRDWEGAWQTNGTAPSHASSLQWERGCN